MLQIKRWTLDWIKTNKQTKTKILPYVFFCSSKDKNKRMGRWTTELETIFANHIWLKWRRLTIKECWREWGAPGTLTAEGTGWGGGVWCGTTSLENISAVSYKGKHTSTIGLSRCTAMYLFQRSESLKLHKDLYTNVHSFICNRPKLKTMLSIYQQVKRKSRLWYILTIGATQK